MYVIEELLNKKPVGSKAAFARKMNLKPQTVRSLLTGQNPTRNSMIKYTKAFNNLFGEKYTKEELFTNIDNHE